MFSGGELVSINASFVFLWGLGDVVGPFISGAAMDVFGSDGMPATGVVVCLLFLGIILARGRNSAEPPDTPHRARDDAGTR